ncbi:CsgG/HfaB family protein [Brachyspira pilosicoli]|uniref:CsgG/HfaB family protein n=1 Tax=Brachyspira pilosicoli TaxID=52584 RepID=UPI000C759631|nr:CsgG/HfaB family protein [Brachyspira pilosicoli]PLV62505.1 curli production assembly protein CsgG [Brachyspira pilosicoli SP16]
MIRKLFYIIFIILFCSNLFSQIVKNEISEKYIKENIAVFEIQDVSTGYSKDLGKKVTTLIENSLTRMKRFNIVDRENLDKYLKEMELQLTGITDEQVIEMGKIYGYSKAITGKITHSSTRYDYDSDDGTGTIYANVDLVLQIVDVSTTKILYSSKVSGSSYYSIDRYPSQAFRDAAIDEACNDLVYKVSAKMRNIFKITLKISDITDGNIILLAGYDHGLTKNTRFKVYSKSEDIVLPSGNVIEGQYKEKGTLRIKDMGSEYSIATISRGKNIQVGDIVRETYIGNFIFGFNINYASYKINPLVKEFQGTNSASGKIKVNLNKNDYALGMHLKFGYEFQLFSPNISMGLLFGDFFKTSYGIDTRFNFDINIKTYQEIVRFVFTPYVGLGVTFTDIGEVYGGDYRNGNLLIPNGTKIKSTDVMLGIGLLANIQYNITDTLGINAGVGYRFYTKPINAGTYYEDNSFNMPEEIKTVNLTGLEFMVGVYGLF